MPTFKYKVGLALGAGVGGLSGALYAGQIGFVKQPEVRRRHLDPVPRGSRARRHRQQGGRAIVGGALVAYLPTRFTEIADYKYWIFGIILVVLMLFRPQGLIPARMHLLTYAREAYHKIWPAKIREAKELKEAKGVTS